MSRARDLAAFVSNADGDIKFDTDTLFIDSSANRVGIGTTTPDDELHIKGVTPAIKIEDTDGSYASISANADNLILGADAGNVGANSLLGFEVDGTERMRIDSNGSVGIGTTPDSDRSTYNALEIGHSTWVAGRTSALQSYFADNMYQDATSNGSLYKHDGHISMLQLTGGQFVFFNAPSGTADTGPTFSEKLRIQSGGGISFNGDTAAANALDDYEEGVYEATLTPTTSGSITLNAAVRKLKYTKIGDTVFVQGLLETSSTSSPVGSSVKLDLPFTAKGYTGANHYSHRVSDHMYISRVAGVSGAGSYGWAITENDTSAMNIEIDASTVHPSGQYSQFYFHFHYQAA